MQHHLNHTWVQSLLLVAASSLVSACVVEDRNFDEEFARSRASDDADDNDNDPGADASDTTSETETLCDKYCDEIEVVCVGEFEMFKSKESCLSSCSKLEEAPPEGEKVAGSNTVACRYAELQGAKEEADVHCPRASIASQSCGNPCETYCRVHPLVCGELKSELKLEQDECERRCEGIPMTPSFSLTDNYADDSIQCRLIHLVTASMTEMLASDHCPHSRIASPEQCGTMTPVSCENYCATLAVACTGERAQYGSIETCEKTCAELPAGTMLDRDKETVGCRHYHAYAALGAPDVHCSHAGPTTDGHCGPRETANCESYCTLAKAACEAEFEDKYETTDGCMEACLPLPGAGPDSEYPPVDGDEGEDQVVQRLILAATKVLGEEADATCDAVFAQDSLLDL